MHRFLPSSFLLASLLATSPAALAFEKTSANFELPKSGEPARRHNPPCGSGAQTTADQIIDGLQAVSITQGYPLVGVALEDEKVANWVKARIGIHDGESVCRTACFMLPAGADFEANISVSPNGWASVWTRGEQRMMATGHAAVIGPTIAQKDEMDVVCWNLKNWKHDKARNFRFNIYY